MLGVVFAALALFIDQLVGIYTDDDDDDADGYCGFNSVRFQTNFVFSGRFLAKCCDDYDIVICAGYEEEDWCGASASGIAWLVFGIIAIIVALIAMGVIVVNLGKFSVFLDFGASICAIMAVICVFIDNEICWDEDDVEDERSRVGASVWLMIIAAVFWVVSGVASFKK